MTIDDQELLLHTMKAIRESQRRHNEYADALIDSMFRELNIHIPERRIDGDRRNKEN